MTGVALQGLAWGGGAANTFVAVSSQGGAATNLVSTDGITVRLPAACLDKKNNVLF